MSLRVIVTGSRTWTDKATIRTALRLVGEAASYDMTVVHGSSKGADAIADEWATDYSELGVKVDRWPADWRTFGKKAGPARNREMVAAGADLVLAFIRPCSQTDCLDREPHGSHGASQTVDLAHACDIPVRVIG